MAKKVKKIKLWDGWRIIVDGKEECVCSSPTEVWDWLGWDINSDKAADECARIITSEMFCFHYYAFPKTMTPGHTVEFEAIPATDNESDWEEVEE